MRQQTGIQPKRSAMKITRRNKLIIDGATQDEIKEIKKLLSLPNPLYDRLKRMGNVRALYACPREFEYYEEKNGKLIVPAGTYPQIVETYNPVVADETSYPQVHSFNSTITLRDYQYGIIDQGPPTEGIYRLDTGFGKTIIALKLAEQLRTRTLIVVPKLALLAQFQSAIRTYLDFEPGVIQGNKLDIKDITIATSQTLSKRVREGKLLPTTFGLVIADECHLYVPRKSRLGIEFFQSRYRFGFTATPQRGDGQTEAIKFIFGPIIKDRKLQTVEPTVEVVDYEKENEHWEYGEIINKVVDDLDRNKLIVSHIERAAHVGRKVLVLTKRINHFENIHGLLPRSIRCHTLRSKGTPAARAREIDSLRRGDLPFDCLLGTFSLLSTGVDIPQLDTLVIAGDLRSAVLTRQSVGRILRLHETKKTPKIIDIQDVNNGILGNQARERRRFYKQEGWL